MIRELTPEMRKELVAKARKSRADIIAMTHLAGSGHPGGSMSSIDIYTLLYHIVDMDTDKIVVSHGHTSPAVYSALARKGLFSPKDVISGFRRVGSVFEGHVEPTVPGVVWGTGNLGQGLSVGCGYAVAARVKNTAMDCFVVMGDGEQQKGQIAEARRFISKYGLTNITVIIDNNELQISGSRLEVMPQDFRKEYEAAGFAVLDVDGHDFSALYKAIRKAVSDTKSPYAIVAHTIMGKGVSFMENRAEFHGRALNKTEMEKALPEIDLDWPLEELAALRKNPVCEDIPETRWPFPKLTPGPRRMYGRDVLTDNRSALGNALLDMAKANREIPFAVFDCDLAGSVKTEAFAKEFPANFFQAGISEHHTAAMAGAASTQDLVSVFADFGMFGIDETYNQQRLNAINRAHLKLLCTHLGIDVGEDGKTHQCIDYLGLFRNLEGFSVIIPLDPNETDLAARLALSSPGNYLIGVGRSKTPVLTDDEGREFFSGSTFAYGKAHHLRKGGAATLFALGAMSAQAVKTWEILHTQGIDIEVVGVSCPFALEEREIREAASRGPLFVLEDHLTVSGLASQIAFTAATNSISIELIPMGISGFPPSGPSDSCLARFGLNPEALANRIRVRVKGKV
ncbi:MAG TPA: transketolase [Deltaproteobacteria bacterium]|nr:transketolase [Deltaproteobacteria bacterium]HQJ07933.1 transketolase [Deltaproteobacteria bacterium]